MPDCAEDSPTSLIRRRSPSLTTRQRTHLRGLGHHLDPVVLIGKEGLSQGLLANVDEQLDLHELLKLRISENAPGDRHEMAETLAAHCGAALVQVLGRRFLLYRRRPDSDPRPHVTLGD